MKKDLISIKDLTSREIDAIFALTDKLKKNKIKFNKALSGKTLALIFQKPSNRTRVSFEVGCFQLGAHSIYISPGEINLGVRESVADAAKTLSRYVDGIILRTFEHKTIVDMAEAASVPVINGLSDFSHPCQALADIYTIKEKLSHKKRITLAYIGDGNNVCNSLLVACAKVGINMNVGAPAGFEPNNSVMQLAKKEAKKSGVIINLFNNPKEAVAGSDIIYTDVWASMGQEKEVEMRKSIFKDFQINDNLVKLANKGALIMHCLPAHRGEEITSEVIDGKNSIVFDQAENRMYVQKAVLIKLLGDE